MKIYVVLSKTNDECSAANRAFVKYEAAYKYMREREEELGCKFYMPHLELDDWRDLRPLFEERE